MYNLFARSLTAAQREFRLQMANASENTESFADTEFGVVAGKLDRFFRLRDRRIDAARTANKRNLIRREFGSLLDMNEKTN